jgi:hypothetical protein
MGTTTIFLQGGVEQAQVDSSKVKLEAFGVALRDHPDQSGKNVTLLIPWHRIHEVRQTPEEAGVYFLDEDDDG